MSNNKSYNSILFLTTLSVYLGLVLVGASPSVLAQQAALTSKFEVQTEFEIEEDLDKNPGEDDDLEQYFSARYSDALTTFIEDLRKLNRNGKYKLSGNEEVIIGGGHTFCAENVVDVTSSYVASWVSAELEKLRTNLDIAEGKHFSEVPGFVELSIDEKGNTVCKEFNLDFSLDKTQLALNTSFTQGSSQKAVGTSEFLNALFSKEALESKNSATKKLYENTKAKVENQYVTVVTRLARGSLNRLVINKRRAR